MKKKLGILITLFAFVVAMTGCGGSSSVAKVGSDKITTAEYNFFLSIAKSKVMNLFGTETMDWKTKIQNQTAEEFTKQLALEDATEFKISLAKAKESKIDLTSTEIDNLNKNINDYISSLSAKKLDQEKALKEQYGVSVSSFKSIYREYAQAQKYDDDWKGKVAVTDSDLQKYFDDNKDNFAYATVRHILYATVDSNKKALPADKVAAAEKNANDMLAQVKAGGDMAALAEKFSEDPGVKDNKGQYSFYKSGADISGSGSYVKEFVDWAFSHSVGDSGIVKSEFGFHVMKLEKMAGFADVKDSVKSAYTNKKFSDQMELWKKDAKFKLEKDQKAIDAIKIE